MLRAINAILVMVIAGTLGLNHVHVNHVSFWTIIVAGTFMSLIGQEIGKREVQVNG